MEEKKKSGFGTASLVLGIIGICTSFIPIVNNLSAVLGILGIIFGVISLIKKSSKGIAIAGVIISLLAIVITINAQKTLSEAIDNAFNDLNSSMGDLTGENTEEILRNNVEVEIGTFEVKEGSYGLKETQLKVNVKNKTSEQKSFNIQIEAVDENGSRIANDYIYANSLNAGQNQEFKVFEYVESEKLENMKKATFKVVEASMY